MMAGTSISGTVSLAGSISFLGSQSAGNCRTRPEASDIAPGLSLVSVYRQARVNHRPAEKFSSEKTAVFFSQF
jgi:hypothetical protein